MLNFFRTRANSIYIKVLMAFLVFTFALWGVGDMLRNANIELALQVGDQHVDQFKWQRMYQQQLAVISEQIGRTPTKDEILQLGIDKFIVNNAIDRLLYLEEAKNMNLLVSDEMAKMEIASMPQFQKDGKFNKDVFASILRQSGYSEISFLDMIKEEIAIRSLITAVTVNKTMPDSYIDTFLKALAHKRSGKIYELNSANLTVNAQATDGDITRLYEETKKQYGIPEQRQIEFITWGIGDIKDDIAVKDKELEELYNSRVAMYSVPETRSVSQLLFKDESKAKEAYDLIQQGQSFNEVGKKFFPDKKNFIMAEKVTAGSLDKEINDDIFKAEAGKPTKVFETAFGWHIFLVNSITPAYTKPLAEVKNDLKKSYLDEKRFEQLSELSQKIDKDISMGEDLKAIAAKYSLKVNEVSGYAKKTTASKFPITNNESFIKTAFATDFAATSSATPYKGQEEFFALMVKNIVPESFKPQAEVMAQLKTAWENQQRQKIFTQKAADFAQSISSVSYNKDLAKLLGVKETSFEISYVKPDLAVSLDAFSEIFKLKVSQATDPIKVGDKYQIAFLQKVQIVDTASLVEERKKVQAQLFQEIPEEMIQQYLDSLRVKYKIVINKKLLDM
ncbi:MAG: SurA N-terminal domain-containing protein [Rickettsiales bacterium]